MYVMHARYVFKLYWHALLFINLQVLTGKLTGGPGPTPVYAFSSSTYTVSGDNPLIIPKILFDTLLPKGTMSLPS